jgi:hypothetical protein
MRKDLVAVRSLAKRLLDLPHADWNDWEIDFLQHMARHKGPDPITTRQGEKLLYQIPLIRTRGPIGAVRWT